MILEEVKVKGKKFNREPLYKCVDNIAEKSSHCVFICERDILLL